MKVLVAFVAGLVFAVGLALSGMTQPQKIVGFLDFTGAWDPSLALVMAGAIGVHFFAQRIQKKRMQLRVYPDRVDRRLVTGAALFGVGWGLGGFCPGPALVSTASLAHAALVFVPAMVVGVLAFRLVPKAT